MGRNLAGPTYGECRLTELLSDICQEHGWRCLRQEVHPGRENLVVLIEGCPATIEGGQLLLWDVHQDTVPVEGMTIDPFAGEVRDGRVNEVFAIRNPEKLKTLGSFGSEANR